MCCFGARQKEKRGQSNDKQEASHEDYGWRVWLCAYELLGKEEEGT